MPRIPDFRVLSPDETIQWIQKWGAVKYSNREILESGFWEYVDGKIAVINNAGAMVVLPQDATGRAPVVEQYSSVMSDNIQDIEILNRNIPEIARLYALGISADAIPVPLYLEILDWTALDGSGALGATNIITNALSGDQIIPEKIHINLSADAARSGGSAQILIQDSTTGNVLGRGGINDDHPHEVIDLCDPGAVDEHIQIVIVAGAVHLGAGKISVMSHYRLK